ncbi:MAG TPA: M28 family metallopeptidase [Terriglobales bacterium]|nr:M28 family metallopeptidase [Terriglobales bacterium]
MSSRKPLLFSSLLLLLSLVAFSQLSPAHFDGTTWWDYVKVLAADNMQGRETGSKELQNAEAYVVTQLKQDGLQPAGTNGYYQPVKFIARQIVEKDSSLALVRNGKTEPLALGDDAFFSTRVDLAPSVEAPLVFVGWGLSIPEKNYDDLAGLDLKGKIAVLINGSPSELPGALAAHYQSSAERWKPLHKAGAIGIIGVPNPASMDIPWARMSLNRTHMSMTLADPKFNDTEGEKLYVTFNPGKTDQLFAGSGHTWQEIVDAAKQRKQLPRFPLPISIKATTKLEKHEIESNNVVAELPGNDPQRKNEYVVLSAHIDHIGVGEPVNGDPIYNGAMDNASGSAVLLDIAASLKKSQDKLQRSILFLFVTAEEKGLLGSRYFTAYPTVDRRSIVADINTDMFLPIVPLKVLTVWGLAESDLGDDARQVAEARGIQVQADPEPQRNVFIRSDQYNFIRHGIPALMMGIAPDPNSPEQKELFRNWLTHRYHAPSDDLDQPVDLSAAAQYEEVIRGLMMKVADESQRPEWKSDSFFRRYAENPGGY